MAVTVGPLILQMPWINWQALLDLIGEAHNIPDFARMVLNHAGLQFIQYGLPYAMMGSGSPGELALPGANQGMRMAQAGMPMAEIPAMPGVPAGQPAALGARIKPTGPRPLAMSE